MTRVNKEGLDVGKDAETDKSKNKGQKRGKEGVRSTKLDISGSSWLHKHNRMSRGGFACTNMDK